MDTSEIIPCTEGCTMTWQRYFEENGSPETPLFDVVHKGVYAHPHLSSSYTVRISERKQMYSPIHWALSLWMHYPIANDDMSQHIIKHGGDVNYYRKEYDDPPIMDACFPSSIEILLQAGADITAKGSYGGTVLHKYIWDRKIDNIRALWHHPDAKQLIYETDEMGHTAYEELRVQKGAIEKYPDIAAFLREGTLPGMSVKRAR